MAFKAKLPLLLFFFGSFFLCFTSSLAYEKDLEQQLQECTGMCEKQEKFRDYCMLKCGEQYVEQKKEQERRGEGGSDIYNADPPWQYQQCMRRCAQQEGSQQQCQQHCEEIQREQKREERRGGDNKADSIREEYKQCMRRCQQQGGSRQQCQQHCEREEGCGEDNNADPITEYLECMKRCQQQGSQQQQRQCQKRCEREEGQGGDFII